MSKKRTQPQEFASPDHKLDPAQFGPLNAEFYQGFHQESFVSRLGVLCILHQSPEAVERLLADGVSWGQLALKHEPDEQSAEVLKRNAELELVALRQHAAEVLFRVFWVHAHQEPCPWLALARFRNPGDLKKALDAYLSGKPWHDERAKRVFHARAMWSSLAVTGDGELKEDFTARVDTVIRWMETAASLVRDAPLYNAYKHGMAVVAGQPFTLSVSGPGVPDDLRLVGSEGFRYIGRGVDQVARRHYWQLVSEPVDFEAAAGEVGVFSTLIGTLLEVGALERRVTKPPQEIELFNPLLTPEQVRNRDAKAEVLVLSFAEELAYFE